jgi:hypothetical protein
LAALAEAEIIELRLSDYAISPDSQRKSNRRKDKLSFMSDSNGELAKAMGIAFQAPENYKTILAKGSDGIEQYFSTNSVCFIVNLDGKLILNTLRLIINTNF